MEGELGWELEKIAAHVDMDIMEEGEVQKEGHIVECFLIDEKQIRFVSSMVCWSSPTHDT